MKYKHLSFEERKEIERLYREGQSITKIARLLNRNPSTISRELRRNSQIVDNRIIYSAESANETYQTKRKQKKKKQEKMTQSL